MQRSVLTAIAVTAVLTSSLTATLSSVVIHPPSTAYAAARGPSIKPLPPTEAQLIRDIDAKVGKLQRKLATETGLIDDIRCALGCRFVPNQLLYSGESVASQVHFLASNAHEGTTLATLPVLATRIQTIYNCVTGNSGRCMGG